MSTIAVPSRCDRCGYPLDDGCTILTNGSKYHKHCAPIENPWITPKYVPTKSAPPLTEEDVRRIVREEMDKWGMKA